MNSNEEDVFNHEVAKRSVARAALHLGIETMSEEALDVMGDVLLGFLSKVGSTLSQMVESSNRTSAHTNVLDAIRAIDMCTSPAVYQIHATKNEIPTGVGWKDLASFLLGPDWMTQTPEMVQPEAGGKLGPSATKKKTEKGWEAPYLDEIPPYPLASFKCANPHSLHQTEAQSLHGGQVPSSSHEEYAKQLKDMPDDAFTTEWGAIDEKLSKKKKASDQEHEDAPPTKRVKLSEDGKEVARKDTSEKQGEEKGEGDEKPRAAVEKNTRPSYVPSFLPPFPSSGPGRAIAVADENLVTPSTEVVVEEAKSTKPVLTDPLDVRSSLVKMGVQSSYWGSGWDAEPATKVPAGRKPPSEKDEKAHKEIRVAPLDRPSINRTSRIIEGSIDASN